MRIATIQTYQQGIEAFSRQQSKLATLQQQISTGVRLTKPSDDPAASSRVLELQQSLSLTMQYQVNISTAETQIKYSEGAMNSVENVAHRLRELAIQGNNFGLDSIARGAIGAELEQILEELVSIGNTRDANGDFLFAGYQNINEPFSMNLTGSINHVTYNGDEGQRFLQISESRQIAIDNPGSEIFLRLPSTTALNEVGAPTNTGNGIIAPANVVDASIYTPGNYEIRFTAPGVYDVFDVTAGANIVTGATYVDSADISFQGIRTSITGVPAAGDVFTVSPGQFKDIFESVQVFINTMNEVTTSTQREANMNGFLTDLDVFLDRILDLHTTVGGRLNALEGQKETNEANIINTQSAISSLRDTDLADAVSQLTLEQTTLDAAQAVFARITSSSLFNFLR